MPKPLPSLTPPPEDQKDTRDPLTIALEKHLEDVRQWTEYITNGDPSGIGMIDYGIYRTFEEWVKRKEALDIIDSILQKRLTLGFPYDQKAIILMQILPADRLPPYTKLLEPLLPPKRSEDGPIKLPPHYNPLISTLTSGLHTTASAKSAELDAAKKAEETKKKEEEELKQWELWCNYYGRSNRSLGFPGHPGNPQWTYWGWNEIGREEWWKGRNE